MLATVGEDRAPMLTDQGAPVIQPVKPASTPVNSNCGVRAEPAMGFNWNVSPLALNWALLMPAKFKDAWLVVTDKAAPKATAVMAILCFIFFVGLICFDSASIWFV